MLHKEETAIVDGMCPEMFFAFGIIEEEFAKETLEATLTAGRDGDHNPGSLHARGYAGDFRNSNCTPDQEARIFAGLQKRLERRGFDVINEAAGQTAKTTAKHFHIEYQPKPGEEFWS